jgi:hypothetical protein
MPKVAVQEFLRNGGTLEQLQERFSILVKRHGEFPNLVLLKYHSIDSPMNEEIAQDCRGIILDEADNWKIVCFPYRKFFNFGEPFAATLDVRTMKVYEKLDGSLMSLHWYRGKWRVSSSGSPDASGNVNGSEKTFAQLFWEVFDLLQYRLPAVNSQTDGSVINYFFELMTNENRIVVAHPTPRLVLHGARYIDEKRQNIFCAELPPAKAYYDVFNWEIVKIYDFKTIEEIVEFAKTIDPSMSEGFVVRDANWNRLKIKAPDYVRLHHCKNNLNSFKNLVGLVISNEVHEFLSYFPDMQETFENIKALVLCLTEEIDSKYEEVKGIADQKTFALTIQDYPYKACLFGMRKGTWPNAKTWLKEIQIEKAAEIIEKRKTEASK